MVISLLTAIGVFAARSASLVDMAAGFDRQSVQARLVSDYAGRLAVAELGSGDARAYLDRFSLGADTCASNDKAQPIQTGAVVPCKVLTTDDLAVLVSRRTPSQTLFVTQSPTAPGSFGPALPAANKNSALEGLMRIEIIDAFSGETAPGSPANGGFMDVQFTVTAYAQLRSAAASTAWCVDPTTSTGASIQALRTHVTIPNVPR